MRYHREPDMDLVKRGHDSNVVQLLIKHNNYDMRTALNIWLNSKTRKFVYDNDLHHLSAAKMYWELTRELMHGENWFSMI